MFIFTLKLFRWKLKNFEQIQQDSKLTTNSVKNDLKLCANIKDNRMGLLGESRKWFSVSYIFFCCVTPDCTKNVRRNLPIFEKHWSDRPILLQFSFTQSSAAPTSWIAFLTTTELSTEDTISTGLSVVDSSKKILSVTKCCLKDSTTSLSFCWKN